MQLQHLSQDCDSSDFPPPSYLLVLFVRTSLRSPRHVSQLSPRATTMEALQLSQVLADLSNLGAAVRPLNPLISLVASCVLTDTSRNPMLPPPLSTPTRLSPRHPPRAAPRPRPPSRLRRRPRPRRRPRSRRNRTRGVRRRPSSAPGPTTPPAPSTSLAVASWSPRRAPRAPDRVPPVLVMCVALPQASVPQSDLWGRRGSSCCCNHC